MTCCLSSAQLEVIFITTAQQWSPSCPAVEPQLPSTPASAAQILCDDPSAPAFGVLVNHSPAPVSYTLSSWFGHCLVCPLVDPCLCSPTVNRCLHCPWVGSAVPCSLSAAQLACALSSLPSPPPGSLSASLMKPAPGSWSLTLVTSAPWPFSSDSRQRSAPGSLLPAPSASALTAGLWCHTTVAWLLSRIQAMLTAYRGVLPPASGGIPPPTLASNPVSRGLLPFVTAVLSPSRPASPFGPASRSSFLWTPSTHLFIWTLSRRTDFSVLLLI